MCVSWAKMAPAELFCSLLKLLKGFSSNVGLQFQNVRGRARDRLKRMVKIKVTKAEIFRLLFPSCGQVFSTWIWLRGL